MKTESTLRYDFSATGKIELITNLNLKGRGIRKLNSHRLDGLSLFIVTNRAFELIEKAHGYATRA